MNNLLFIGSFFTERQLATLEHDFKGYAGMSNHNFEMSIIQGLRDNIPSDFTCALMPFTYSYPYHFNKLYTPAECYEDKGLKIFSAGICNLAGINLLLKERAMYHTLCKAMKSIPSNNVKVVMNCPNTASMSALYKVAKHLKKLIETTLIVPDIPSMINDSLGNKNNLKHFLVSRMDKKNTILANKFDHFVFLTEQMKEWYAPKDYIVMEGIANQPEKLSVQTKDIGGKKSFLYSGSLHSIYGILDLIEAFNIGHFHDTELWICGSGDASETVRAASERNLNIKYFGLVSSAKARELQGQATVLVNPRTDEGEYTKYSFPSKTMEYLLAAKPVIMNRLPGVPDEYYNYVFTPEERTVISLSRLMEKVISMPREDLDAKAQAGYHFVAEHKNPKVQMKRVLDMFEK